MSLKEIQEWYRQKTEERDPYASPVVDALAGINRVGELLEIVETLEAQVEQKPIRVSVKPDGQVWVVLNAGEGRKAILNLNNIVLAKESGGITKGIMLDAIAKALEEVSDE